MYRVKILFVYLLLKTNFYLVEAVEAVEDNLSAKAAGNESVDGRMTACDDKIGRRTTTQQPTNERRMTLINDK
jgi:hypothetical protein